MKRKIYVVGASKDYACWMQGKLVNDIEKADLVCFTGGEDVSPELYNEPRHSHTGCNLDRDEYETAVFHKALSFKKPMIGICRGAQFLCVMNGGKLVQHQENRYSSHPILTHDGQKLIITSTHHQAQYPWNLEQNKDFKLLGWTKNLSKYHFDGNNQELEKAKEYKVENVYYPKHQCLGIQGHPEWMPADHVTIKYLQNQLDQFIKNEL